VIALPEMERGSRCFRDLQGYEAEERAHELQRYRVRTA